MRGVQKIICWELEGGKNVLLDSTQGVFRLSTWIPMVSPAMVGPAYKESSGVVADVLGGAPQGSDAFHGAGASSVSGVGDMRREPGTCSRMTGFRVTTWSGTALGEGGWCWVSGANKRSAHQ